MSQEDDRLGQPEDNMGAEPARRGPGRPPKARVAERLADGDARDAQERDMNERDLTEDRDFSDDDRFQLFKDSLFQSVLPDLPQFPGYHTCWLTTNNPRDTIPRRLQIGYELIMVAQCPGWAGVAPKAGDYAGIVAVNEMVAARIPLRLYRQMMNYVHHEEPLSQEEKLKSLTEAMQDGLAQRGLSLQLGDGTANVVQRARAGAEAFPG